MTNTISRRGFLGGVAALALGGEAVAAASPMAPETSLRPVARGEDLYKRSVVAAEDLIAQARLNGTVGFSVANVATGEVLEGHEAGVGLPPASVAKALTASYALDTLGPGHVFRTRLMATGGVVDGIVQGDLILAGGGDPTLDTDGLAGLAGKLKAAGVTGVKGVFQVWGGALPHVDRIDVAQPPHVGYSPAVSGLNLNYNRVHFEWRKSGANYAVSMDARSAAHRPAVRFARMQVEARTIPVYTYADRDGRDDWTVARGALGTGGARWLPVRKPEVYAGEVFQSFAKAQGIALTAPEVIADVPEDAVTLAGHESAALRIILRDMMKYSTNLTAEVVGMSATKARTGHMPEGLSASAAELNTWAAETLGATGVALVDHSGLGDQSRVSAADMALALRALRQKLGIKPLMKSFPMRDAQRQVMQNHPLKVHAKTGTLNFVSGLAGFVDLPDGTELVFAIFAADMERRAGLTMAERERPEGGRSWNVRAKTLQQKLIERWGVLYAA